MSGTWFETVAEAQRRAKKRLPKSVYGALLAGGEKGVTLRDNVEAFDELGLVPHLAGLSAKRNLATTVMGQPVSLPVLISPTGVQAVHPEGEVAVARAAAARGTVMGLSSFASMPIEEVVAVNPKTLFQMYWIGTRDEMELRMERARQVGAVGLIATLDWTFANGRDWGSPHIPERMSPRELIRLAPEGLARPRWLASFLRTGNLPSLTVPNMTGRGEAAPTFFGAYGQWMQTPLATWEDVAWLRSAWGGPFLLKGVSRIDDAKRAVDAGVTAISVSNHGGNNVDGTPAAIRLLPGIAETVGGQVEVLLDGGIRRGSDVVKALALGARTVMIGRAYLWGLAARGQAGVENVLDVLRGGIDSALLGLGHSDIGELSPDDLQIPPGFTRRAGGLPGGHACQQFVDHALAEGAVDLVLAGPGTGHHRACQQEHGDLHVGVLPQFPGCHAAPQHGPEHFLPGRHHGRGVALHQPRVLDALAEQQHRQADVLGFSGFVPHRVEQRDQVLPDRLALRYW